MATPAQVRPDGNGGLEVVPEGIKFLQSLSGEFEVVGVVGTFHTGKSFLLNQLMGRTHGFELGPTVRPTTEGLWIWGAPMTEDSGLSVLFMDTEGLSAPGNTADYDAKIFAVATLLSSHILYNSVKIIDENSLEYLQVLARRAQLFSLKTLLHQEDLTSLDGFVGFPPLTWVVEDFFQQQLEGETPTEWLRRIMRHAFKEYKPRHEHVQRRAHTTHTEHTHNTHTAHTQGAGLDAGVGVRPVPPRHLP